MSAHHDLQAGLVQAANAVSVAITGGALVGALPPIAALVTIVWYAIQIFESHIVKARYRLHRRRVNAIRRALEQKRADDIMGNV